MIVDTNGLSAWWLNEPSFIRHIEHADRLCVPVPALAEFRFGILKSRFRERMTAWLDDALTTTTVLVADEITTRHYAEIRLQLATAGTPIPMNDLWIAAIARQHKLPVLSRDTHFDHVSGLTRVGWSTAGL
jgi:tRNA(fMet)-specific endonuclease VapC